METYSNGMTLPGHIETLFKAEAPFEPVANGHGFIGILLLDKMEDTIQCHLCGRWFKFLGTHLKFKHETTSHLYRRQFGLPLSFPLCSRGVSQSRSKKSSSPEHLAMLASITKAAKGRFWDHKHKDSWKYSKTNAAFLNQHGLCHDQILRRFLIVADIVGKEPSNRQLRIHDAALLQAIIRRHGNVNTFRKQEGFTIVKQAPILTDDRILAAIRSKARLLGRRPTSHDFKVAPPSLSAIINHFGSWNRALETAGFHRTPHSHERRTQ